MANVIHRAPSQIAADTFARSKGRIPEAFLQGCGLSSTEMEDTELSNPKLNSAEMNRRFTSQSGTSGFAAFYLVQHKS